MPIHPALEFEIRTTERKELPLSSSSSFEGGLDSTWWLHSPTLSSVVLSPHTVDTARHDDNHSGKLGKNQLLPVPVMQQHEPPQQIDDITNPPLDTNTQLDSNNISSPNNNCSSSFKLTRNWHGCLTCVDFYYWLAVLCLVISGVGIALTLKLQAVPMYNYPNFLNIYTNLLYIPLCFAYIAPITGSRWKQLNGGNSDNNSNNNSFTRLSSLLQLSTRSLILKMMIIGVLDAITATFQTFAAVYVPGPLLVVVPQAAIPVSMLCTYFFTDTKVPQVDRPASTSPIISMSAVGSIIVLIGIIIVLVPVWSSQRAPDYYCEALDPHNDCSICKIASTETECIEKPSHNGRNLNVTNVSDFATQWLLNKFDNLQPYPDSVPCQWIPFDESTKEKEKLEVIWSILLLTSTIPMAFSALYKQRVIHRLSSGAITQTDEMPDSALPLVRPKSDQNVESFPVLLISGWIAVFQLLPSILLTIPAGMMSSPSIQPWKVPENLWNGLLCYAGYPVVSNGCHPDTMCPSYHVTLWINLGVLCHVVYTVSVMVILQASSDCTPLFLALTCTIPLGYLAFTLPLLPLPSREYVDTIDWIGVILIVSGLVLYRFTNDSMWYSKRRRHNQPSTETNEASALPVDGSLSQQIQSSISSILMQITNQTSYTLLREPLNPDNN
jgi:hypothetical protein